MKQISTKHLIVTLLLSTFVYQSCDVEPDIYSEVLPDQYFQNEAQLASAASVAYLPLGGWFETGQILNDLTTDQSTVAVRSNNGWDDGGVWPRLMAHDFEAESSFVTRLWDLANEGVASCNRLVEILTDQVGATSPAVYELRTLRAFYFYVLLSNYGNIPIETRFSDADPTPAQVTAQEAWSFLEQELLESIDNLSESTGIDTYGKVNKWVGYMLLADLYLNSERITGVPKWQEAADATNVIINSGAYSIEPAYFTNFRTRNEGSSENMFVIPYERGLLPGFNVRHQMHQSGDGTFDMAATPWGGMAIQEDFYNAFDEDDKRRGMFIVGQMYTPEAGPTWSDEEGFHFTSPDESLTLTNCIEDFDNYAEEFQPLLEGGCNIFITPGYTEIDGRYPYRHGARYGKWEIPVGETFDISADFALYRYAQVLLTRAEALWRLDNGSPEALMLVNQIRDRADLEPLAALTEDDIYWEFKKELAMENHARETTIRFGHWEDDWFLKGEGSQKGQPSQNFDDEFRRIYPIPQSALQANASLEQNPGYN